MPLPNPTSEESKKEFLDRCMSDKVMNKEFSDPKQRYAVCNSQWKKHLEHKECESRVCLRGGLDLIEIKEDDKTKSYIIKGLVATTHPDRVGTMLSVNALKQIVDKINDNSKAGDDVGAYRSISLYHDWVRENDPTLDEVAFVKPNSAKLVKLDDGHYGVEIEAEINMFYNGKVSPEEVLYRIKKGLIAGFSVEFKRDRSKTKKVEFNGEELDFIDGIESFGGIGLARQRLIANPHAVIYREIENLANNINLETKEAIKMSEEENKTVEQPKNVDDNKEKLNNAEEQKDEVQPENKPEEKKQEENKEKNKEELEQKEVKKVDTSKIDIREIINNPEFKKLIDEKLEVKEKVLKTKGDMKMEAENNVPLEIREVLNAAKEKNWLEFREAGLNYIRKNEATYGKMYETTGIPLVQTLDVRCVDGKLKIVGGLETRDVLDTTTNTSSYTQNIVEFADVYVPGIVDTFNNQRNFFGALRKIQNPLGTDKYGWKIRTSKYSGTAVDPDDTTVTKKEMGKQKLQTPMKEYRLGIEVTDYVLFFSKAAIGDLFGNEVNGAMDSILTDIDIDLFTEQVDSGNKILGLEAVADSAGNTSIYGLTRTTNNRLAPDAASDTYEESVGALTTSSLRNAITKVEVEGAKRGNLRIVTSPQVRDYIFNLEDGKARYGTNPTFGFSGDASYDGIPMIVDSNCPAGYLYVVDFESEYIVIGKAPTLRGLAKSGASESAFISTYLAHVYEQPRRIHLMKGITGP